MIVAALILAAGGALGAAAWASVWLADRMHAREWPPEHPPPLSKGAREEIKRILERERQTLFSAIDRRQLSTESLEANNARLMEINRELISLAERP